MTKNKKAITLSLIIPAYNEENYIAGCLDAIARQTVMPDEVIVVDNNSSDRTAAVAASYKFVRVINEPRQGIVFARNTGFNAAQFDILGRIDADTHLHKNWVETVKHIAMAHDESIAFTGPCGFRDWYGKMILFWGHRIIYFWSTYLFLGHNTLFGSNMFLRKSLWGAHKNNMCNRNDIHEDMDLSIHIKNSGGKVSFDETMQATISPRRIFNMRRYPMMWFKTKIVHLRKRK